MHARRCLRPPAGEAIHATRTRAIPAGDLRLAAELLGDSHVSDRRTALGVERQRRAVSRARRLLEDGNSPGRRRRACHHRHVGAVTGPLAGLAAVVHDAVRDPGRRPREAGHPDPAVRHPPGAEETRFLRPRARLEDDDARIALRHSSGIAVMSAQLESDGTRPVRAGVHDGDVRPVVRVGAQTVEEGFGGCFLPLVDPGGEETELSPGRTERRGTGPCVNVGQLSARHPDPQGSRIAGGPLRPDAQALAAKDLERVGKDELLAGTQLQRDVSASPQRRSQALAVAELEGRLRAAPVGEDHLAQEPRRRLDENRDRDAIPGDVSRREREERAVVRAIAVHDTVGPERTLATRSLDGDPAAREAGPVENPVELCPPEGRNRQAFRLRQRGPRTVTRERRHANRDVAGRRVVDRDVRAILARCANAEERGTRLHDASLGRAGVGQPCCTDGMRCPCGRRRPRRDRRSVRRRQAVEADLERPPRSPDAGIGIPLPIR